MISRSEKVRLGVFLLVSFGLLILVIGLLAGYHFTRAEDIYTARFEESVSGLEIGAQVKYNGVRVGQITDIQIDRQNLSRVIATMSLRQGTPVKADAKAVLVVMGITGIKFVEIRGGTTGAKLLSPGSEIRAGTSLMGTLEGKAEDIAVKMELALTKINLVLSEENIAEIHKIIANVGVITSEVAALLTENRLKINQIITNVDATARDLREAVASINRSSGRIEGLIDASDPKVRSILDNINAAANDFRQMSKSLSKVDKILVDIGSTLDKLNGYLKKVDVEKIAGDTEVAVDQAKEMLKSLRRLVDASRGDMYQSVKSLRTTLHNLEQLSDDLKEQPSLLIRGKPPEERTKGE